MKQEDKFESFVRNNKSHFDDKEPTARLWSEIESKLDINNLENNSWLKSNYWKVAAIFFFVAASVLSMMLYQSQSGVYVAESSDQIEFETAEAYYANAISEKKIELVALSASSPELIEQFESDLHVLDSLYLNLKSGVENSGDPRQIQNAMVQNLKLRIEILNMQLGILTNIRNTQNSQNDEINL
jgi:hypothetical protein